MPSNAVSPVRISHRPGETVVETDPQGRWALGPFPVLGVVFGSLGIASAAAAWVATVAANSSAVGLAVASAGLPFSVLGLVFWLMAGRLGSTSMRARIMPSGTEVEVRRGSRLCRWQHAPGSCRIEARGGSARINRKILLRAVLTGEDTGGRSREATVHWSLDQSALSKIVQELRGPLGDPGPVAVTDERNGDER